MTARTLAAAPQADKVGEPRELTRRERAIVGRARLRHGLVIALGQLPDSAGLIGAPCLALSVVAILERHGTIGAAQRQAGDEFHRLFRAAQLDALKAAALDRVPGGLCHADGGGSEWARRKVGAAIRVLGGEASVTASCAWHVLGLEWSLRDWSAKAMRGNVHRATGVLVASLAILAPHFGLDKPVTQNIAI